ncbi:MAG: hypothetical protein HQM09_05355 [Candidatus Riflebacteria bacterium]|nr:hypothetical protein [Candidatus Riflebacteria bacterium]
MTLLVFSMGLLPLIVLFQTSHKSTAKAKNLMVAQSLGRTMIDEVRSMGFDGVRANFSRVNHGWKQVTGSLVPGDASSINYPEYYGKFETMMVADELRDPRTDRPYKYLVKLSVRWQEPGIQQEIGFGTVMVKYGAR